MDQQTDNGWLGLVLIGLLIVCVVALIKTTRSERKQKKAQKKALDEIGFVRVIPAIHLKGLPLTEGVSCSVAQYRDRLEIGYARVTLNLTFDRIREIKLVMDRPRKVRLKMLITYAKGNSLGNVVLDVTKKKSEAEKIAADVRRQLPLVTVDL